MSTPAVRIDVRPDAVAVLTIDQPGSKVNVLTPALVAELDAAVNSLTTRTDLKGLVVASGKPGVFIAGADIKMFANAPGPNDPTVRAYIGHGLRVLEKLEALPFPTCAAIDGAALGGGLELALACDYRVVGNNPKVQLGLPEVKLGLIPGWGGTQRLPREVGMVTTAELLTTGASVPGADAKPLRLAGDVVDSGSLLTASASLLTSTALAPIKIGGLMRGQPPQPFWRVCRIRKNSPVMESERSKFTGSVPDTPTAVREAVRVMTAGAALPLADAIKLETEAFLRLAGSDESKRLIAAFFASRKK